jgi:hypothetical protein
MREHGHDSSLREYVEVGRGLGWEVPIFQCFLSGGAGSLPPRGFPIRLRARIVGKTLGVAVQADDCIVLADRGA